MDSMVDGWMSDDWFHYGALQVQSSWFPLYDRNPQTHVRNIFFVQAAGYVKATQGIHHAPGEASSVELPVVTRAFANEPDPVLWAPFFRVVSNLPRTRSQRGGT